MSGSIPVVLYSDAEAATILRRNPGVIHGIVIDERTLRECVASYFVGLGRISLGSTFTIDLTVRFEDGKFVFNLIAQFGQLRYRRLSLYGSAFKLMDYENEDYTEGAQGSIALLSADIMERFAIAYVYLSNLNISLWNRVAFWIFWLKIRWL
jgi:hypothetical protein